uniref:DDE Tnp4 domain-containing protein n=1 Tax=Oncorhynchus tshawytscha TaxID=74940 RepID=A0A8C8EIV6_ONCTS
MLLTCKVRLPARVPRQSPDHRSLAGLLNVITASSVALAKSRWGPRERVFREQNYFDDPWLINNYHLPRNVLLYLCADLAPYLERKTCCNHAIPVSVQVLSTLGFLATGTFQREMGDRSVISQPSFSRILPQVIEAILHVLSKRYITEFVRSFNFPGVIGAVDCMHIAKRAPSVDEHVYVNTKNFRSLNVQITCDARMQVLNVCSKWPGSTHNSFILHHCRVGLRLEAVEKLLCDRGYQLKMWLLTPFADPLTAEETTRSVEERTIGLLRSRWPCRDASGGKFLYKPEKNGVYLNVCSESTYLNVCSEWCPAI